FELDLYVNYRPVKLLDARLCPLKDRSVADVNFVVFRENTEGLYVGIGGRFKAGTNDEVSIQEELNTYKGVHRIVKHAFEFAKATGRRRVCMADKSNAMTQGHALWQRVLKEVAPQYPGVEARHLYIDALVLLMVQNPAQFDVIVTNNLFGDIITDLGPRCRAASAWRRPATSIPAAHRCSSRCMGRPRRLPGRMSPIRSARSSRPRSCWSLSGSNRKRPRSKRPCRTRSSPGTGRKRSAAHSARVKQATILRHTCENPALTGRTCRPAEAGRHVRRGTLSD